MHIFCKHQKYLPVHELPLILALLVAPVNSFSLTFHHHDAVSVSCHQTKNSNWNVGDDWSELSSSASTIESSSIFNVDAAAKAALDLEQWMNEDNDGEKNQEEIFDFGDDNERFPVPSVDDDLMQNAIDTIQSYSLDPNGPALYDTFDSINVGTKTVNFVDEIGKEIALLVRCNERPDELLVDAGKALPSLSDEEKYNVFQLVNKKQSPLSETTDNSMSSHEYEPSAFLIDSVNAIFRCHAKARKIDEDTSLKVLDYVGIASWLSKSLDESVGQHDKRTAVIMSKYATYGTGFLTAEQFMEVYVDAVMRGLDNTKKHEEKQALNLLKKMKMKAADVMSVWRDFKNHDILPPIVTIREELQAKIDAQFGTYDQFSNMEVMDECEILEWKNDEDLTRSRRSKSSHELVELASDRKTPKRIKDGEFGTLSV